MSYVRPEDVAARCDAAKPMAGGWIAVCPAHDDNEPSLRISEGKRGTVLFCHAGCTTDEILGELGLQPQMLFYDYKQGFGTDTLELRTFMKELHRERRGRQLQPGMKLERVDDVMWMALVTEQSLKVVPEEIWAESMAMTTVGFPYLTSLPFTDAMQMVVVFRDGPLFDFLRPYWEKLGRPDWRDLRRKALKKMHEVYREMQDVH